MNINNLLDLITEKISINCPRSILHADKPTGQPPVNLFDIEEQNENYLALANGETLYKGALTGILSGMPGIVLLLMSGYSAWNERYESALEMLLLATALFAIPFTWEVMRPPTNSYNF